jgi:SAM-dependent methyltransferase
MKCRFCQAELQHVFLDLGAAPPSNAFLNEEQLHHTELYFPLKLFTCHHCFLVQVDEVQDHTSLFSNDYVYFSSFSKSWLKHAKCYADAASTLLNLGSGSLVVEIASNDGYLLQYFQEMRIPCIGIEPTASTAQAARLKGIETVERFFGREFTDEFTASRGKADLLIGNNVLAHVPDINDFVSGIAAALKDEGVASFEFPHIMEMIANNQFDTVYHEHFSYLSFHTVQRIFAAHGLRLWDVERLTTHGGSLRIWACLERSVRLDSTRIADLLALENTAGMTSLDYYGKFQDAADSVKNQFLSFLIAQKQAGKCVAAYGAAAKGCTLLNYAGVKPDLLPYVVDASPHKQGKYLPGSRIPVLDESALKANKPDFIIILPWNLKNEIIGQIDYVRSWGGKFTCAVPSLEIL